MKMLIKFIVCVMMSMMVSSFVYANEISIEIMGQKLSIDNVPQIIEGRTMVPVRAIFEGIDADVDWDSETKVIKGVKDGTVVIMQIDNRQFSINGSEEYMDAAPLIIEGRTYAPARYVAEAFGFDVDWDSENKTVKIGMINQGASVTTEEKTTVEITTEITTKSTIETTEIATQAYDKYSQTYKGAELRVGSDIPAGQYVAIPDNDKFVSVLVYNYDNVNSATGRHDAYYAVSEYRDVINLDKDYFVKVTNGVLVPIDDVENADITRNGKFRVGVDISAGLYTFKLDPESLTGYVEISNLTTDRNIKIYKLNEYNTEMAIKLEKGTVVKKYGVDMYDSALKMYADYSLVNSIKTNSSVNLNFDEIRDSYKGKIDKEISGYLKNYYASSKSATKYSRTYVNNMVAEWKSTAENSSEKKYAEIASGMLDRMYNFAHWSKFELVNSSYVRLGETTILGSEYEKGVVADRDMYNKFARDFLEAQSFEKLEAVYYNLRSLSYSVPIGQGYEVKNMN